MSNAQNAYGGGSGNPGAGAQAWTYGHGACAPGSRGWTAFELAAVALGLIVFWPIGLAILGYKLWQRKMGGPDIKSLADEGWRWARNTFSGASAAPARGWTSNWAPGSGNSAFDAWKAAEIARLEEERRKLEIAHREFKEFLDNVRKAKDREEFERFMNDRRNRQGA